MSVYKPKGSPFYHFDFYVEGIRFYGSTKTKIKREARSVEAAERENARVHARSTRNAKIPGRLSEIAGAYWAETGQHHAGKSDTWRQLDRLIGFFGKDTLLSDIDDSEVARLVAWRRGHRVVRGNKKKPEDCPLIGPFTVNDTTEQLKKLFSFAKRKKIEFKNEPEWKDHWLKEPRERVRELHGDEGQQLEDAAREDYLPYFQFAHASAMRSYKEGLLRWSEVHWEEGQIIKEGKQGRTVTVPLTNEIREILLPLRGHHPEFVFTYIAQRTRGCRVKGKRYPLTKSGVKTQWRRMRKRHGVVGFRLYDYRHDTASKVVRKTGNLKIAQRLLNHANITTTMRYVHVLDSDVAEALESVAKSRTESRKGLKKAS